MRRLKYELERIANYQLSKEDFSNADQDSVAALAALSFAISEVNVFLRLYLFIEHDFNGPEELDAINFFQRNSVLRVISAKIFEASKLIMLDGKHNKTHSSTLKELLRPYQRSFRWLKKHPGYSLVQSLRNEATSHYCLSPARKNLETLPPSSDFSFILHEMDGNTLYVMGETVMHYERVLRHNLDRLDSIGVSGGSEYDLWLHWNVCALRWLRRAHLALAKELSLNAFPDRSAREKMIWIPEGTSASPKERLTPLFVRRED